MAVRMVRTRVKAREEEGLTLAFLWTKCREDTLTSFSLCQCFIVVVVVCFYFCFCFIFLIFGFPMLLIMLSEDWGRRKSREEILGCGAEWLSVAQENWVLPTQHLGDVKQVTSAKNFADSTILLPHFLSAFMSLLETTRALGLLQEDAIWFCQHSH